MSLAEYEDFVFTAGLLDRARSGRRVEEAERAAAAPGRFPQRQERLSRRRRQRHRRAHERRRHDAGSTATATRISPTAKSSPARCIDSVERPDQLQLPRRAPRPRSARREADLQERQSRRRQRRQGRRLPHQHARHGRRQPLPRRMRHRHQLRHHAATRRTPSSTKRSAAPSISPSAPAIPKPATTTNPACTGTWSSTCARRVCRDRRGEVNVDGKFTREGWPALG